MTEQPFALRDSMAATMKTKIVIRQIGVISVAKVTGVLYALLGLIIGAIVSLFAMIGSAFMNSMGGASALFGVGSIILFPILYGAIGFVCGLITGALYNVVAGMVGGVEIETDQTQIQ